MYIYIHLMCYLELFHTVRAKAGSVFMTKPDWITDWNGVNWNLHAPITTSEQVIALKKKGIFQQCTFMHQCIWIASWVFFFKSFFFFLSKGEQLVYQIPNNKVLTTKIGLLNSLREYDRISSKINNGKGHKSNILLCYTII